MGPSVITFDFFDTLMFRRVPRPTDAFLAVHTHLVDQGIAREFSAPEFKRLRETAESQARVGEREIHLDAIWKRLHEISGIDAQLGLKSELKIEREVLAPYWPALEVLEWAAAAGKTVCIVSDTYFSSDFLRQVLPRQVQPLVHHVFASCEWGAGKGDGLWPVVISSLGMPPEEMFHVGDNYEVDVVVPVEHGLWAALAPNGTSELWSIYPEELALDPRGQHHAAVLDRGLMSLRARATHARRVEDRTPLFDLGAQVLGPIASGFGSWAALHAETQELEVLLCAHREGPFLANFINGANVPPLVDLSISRKVVLLAGLTEVTEASLTRLSGLLGLLSNATAFRRVLGLSPHSMPQDLGTSDEVISRIIEDSELVQAVLDRALEARTGLLDHIRDALLAQGIRKWPDHVGLVDVGWGGSIQLGLVEVLEAAGIPMKVTGLYLMTGPAIERVHSLGSRARGMLAEAGEPSGFFNSVIRSIEVIEQAFSVAGGSTIGYGTRGPHLADDLIPQAQRGDIAEIQEGIWAFHQAYIQSRDEFGEGWAMSIDALRAILWRFVSLPSSTEVQLFADWVHDDNLGSGLTDPLFLPEIKHLGRYMTSSQLRTVGGHRSYWPSAAAIQYGPYSRVEWIAIHNAMLDRASGAFERESSSGAAYVYVDAGLGFSEPIATSPLNRNILGLSCLRFVDIPMSGADSVRIDPCDREGIVTLGPVLFRFALDDGSVSEELISDVTSRFAIRGAHRSAVGQFRATEDMQLILAREFIPAGATSLDLALGLQVVPLDSEPQDLGLGVDSGEYDVVWSGGEVLHPSSLKWLRRWLRK